MTELQWALVIVGAAAVLAVYFFSRRDRALKNWQPPGASDSPLKPKPPTREQMDMFAKGGGFDELGVGKPRRPGEARRAPDLEPAPRYEPAIVAAKTPVAAPAVTKPVPVPAPPPLPPLVKPEEKYITLLIAELEGTSILGPKLHHALRDQGLEFGAREIYHRQDQGMVQFSVASLVKPGSLDPADVADFSTPGLSVFMVLPGPVKPVVAFDDMLRTCRALARALNAEVFDVRRQVLSDESAKELRAEVDSWARGQNLA